MKSEITTLMDTDLDGGFIKSAILPMNTERAASTNIEPRNRKFVCSTDSVTNQICHNPVFREVPHMKAILASLEDETSTVGYLGDAESGRRVSSLVLQKQSSSKRAFRRLRCITKNQSCNATIPCRRGHRSGDKKERIGSEGQRWIQRVYSNTPFSLSMVQDIEALEDISRTIGITNSSLNQMWPKSIVARPIMKRSLNGLRLPRGYRNKEVAMPSFSDFPCLSTDERGGVEQEDEYSALFSVVSALLKECHESQAQYRTYSPDFDPERRTVS